MTPEEISALSMRLAPLEQGAVDNEFADFLPGVTPELPGGDVDFVTDSGIHVGREFATPGAMGTGNQYRDDLQARANQQFQTKMQSQRLDSNRRMLERKAAAIQQGLLNGTIPQDQGPVLAQQLAQESQSLMAPSIFYMSEANEDSPEMVRAKRKEQFDMLIKNKFGDEFQGLSAFVDETTKLSDVANLIKSIDSAGPRRSGVTPGEMFRAKRDSLKSEIEFLEGQLGEEGELSDDKAPGSWWGGSNEETEAFVQKQGEAVKQLEEKRNKLFSLHEEMYGPEAAADTMNLVDLTLSAQRKKDQAPEKLQEVSRQVSSKTGLPVALDQDDLNEFRSRAKTTGQPVKFIFKGRVATAHP